MNLFRKWYCNENTLPHNWNLWTSYVIILVQCNFVFQIFQSIVIPVRYHNKSPNLYATWLIYVPPIRSNDKNRLEFPFKVSDEHLSKWCCIEPFSLRVKVFVKMEIIHTMISLLWKHYLKKCNLWLLILLNVIIHLRSKHFRSNLQNVHQCKVFGKNAY